MSDFLETKSKMNKSSGDLLFDKAIYCSCIHCYYYCCLQKMLSMLLILMDKQKMFMDRKNNHPKMPLHEYYSQLYIETIKENGRNITSRDCRKFKDKFSAFKKLRSKADYEDKPISQDEALKAKTLLSELLEIINRV